jgi:hypothetical protein
MPTLSQCLSTFVALLICVAPVTAQETVPPPAPEGVQPRPLLPGERRERLRQFGGQLFNALTNGQGGPIAPGAGGPAQPLDFAKINDAVAALLQPLLAGEASIESFDLRFDPTQTNLAADTVAATANLVLRRSAWSASPSRLHLDLRAVANLNAPGGARATVDGNIDFQTAVVPLANFALQRVKARQAGKIAEPPASADDFFQAYLREKLARTPSLNNFEDVVDFFQYICALRFVAQNDNIDRLKEALAAATDPAIQNGLAAELAAARLQRESMSNVRTHIERDASGNIRAIDLPLANVEISPALTLDRVDLHVTETEVTGKVTVGVERGVEVYALVKPIAILTLQQLQQRDPATVARQRAFIQGLLLNARPFLMNGEF